MQRLIKTSLILLFFSASITIFNISCNEEVEAQITTPTKPQNLGIIIFRNDNDPNNEFWKSNYDGTNTTKVTIQSLPADGDIDWGGVKVSPDGEKLFLPIYFPTGYEIYSCNGDGTGTVKVSNGRLIDAI